MSDVKNTHGVMKRQWAKWSDAARLVFNELYEGMTNDPKLYQHTDAPAVDEEHWEITAWNAAWVAASKVK